ncbi:di-heme oxidoreductase family protein [Celeribacter litoreus]|uniref:di-heme oxidoreductase family protein n=1 Tax=Celeribacter litoreus TaxID=2876714 RepID=UPI001CC9086A|nr:di-heme oxidoredictase family protein [Celeribacter litoreus]MCA0043281.1 thiol oxidoreductase [Celeribacter litoreus]
MPVFLRSVKNLRKRHAIGVTLVLLLPTTFATDLTAQSLSDVHLNVVPRTDVERDRIAGVLSAPKSFDTPQPFEALSAGAASTERTEEDGVFRKPSGGFDKATELDFLLGEALFDKLWVSSPSSTKASDGLGPLYNARACLRCHPGNGRGRPPEGEAALGGLKTSMFLKLSVPAAPEAPLTEIEAYLQALDGDAATPRARPVPAYGGQLQDRAVLGLEPEAKWTVNYEEIEVLLAGGETAFLRKPTFDIGDLRSGPLPDDLQVSPRVANPMIGLGLLEAIPVDDILALADPHDEDGDGISGRPNIVWSREFDTPMLGRFGWKAFNPTVEQQSASALSSDIGISSPLFPAAWGDCTVEQADCIAAPHGDGDVRGTEIDQTGLDLLTLYATHIGVPRRTEAGDAEVLLGKEVFHDIGCAACHQPNFVTHRLADEQDAPLSFQLIWPYTDLLLHDMGEGLADNRPEGRATGAEWRTAPLWGLGLTAQVSGHTYLLHDGRARSVLEAILWHGGEAEAARDAVVHLQPERRAALLRFLNSL